MARTTCLRFRHFANRIGTVLPLSVALAAVLATGANAQRPYANGISVRDFVSNGLPSPASLAYDHQTGILYASSLVTDASVDLYRVLPDGTVETYTNPIGDPDVLTLDAAGFVYVGAFGGKITQIDPSDGSQTQWKKDSRLGNVDGLVFDPNGDLLVSAIDKHTIYRVDHQTKDLTLVADLTSAGNQGYGSIALAPDGTMFVAAPKDGNVVHVAADGTILDAFFLSGLLHVGQLAVVDGFLYASDTGARTVRRIDLTTLQDDLWIDDVPDHSGGFVHLGDGEFYCSWQSLDNLDGGVYRVSTMDLSFVETPRVGGKFSMDLDSIADANRLSWAFLSLNPGTTPLNDGRFLPVALIPGQYFILRGMLDSSGHKHWEFDVPNSPSLGNLTLYVTWVTFAGTGPMGIDEATTIVIEQ